MANQTGLSQRDLRVSIPPGGTVNPKYEGNFVFVKDCPAQIIVKVHEQDIEMERGDFRKVTERFEDFSIKNPGTTTAEVRMVVGFGEYNRFIVQGELNVSAYVKKENGELADSLPMTVERVVGIESEVAQAYVANAVVYDSTDINMAGYGATVFFDEKFWTFTEVGQIYSYSPGDVAGSHTLEGSFTGFTGNMKGGTVTPDGRVYWLDSEYIFRMEWGRFSSVLIASTYTDNDWIAGVFGIHWFNGFLYLMTSANELLRMNEDGSGQVIIKDFGVNNVSGIYGWGNKIQVIVAGGHKELTLNAVGNIASEVTSSPGQYGSAQCASSDGLYVAGVVHNYGFKIIERNTVTIEAKLYSHPVGEIGNKTIYPMTDALYKYPHQGADIIAADWLGMILEGMGGLPDIENYLTGYTVNSGRSIISVDSGTEVFSVRGIVPPDLHAEDGSTLEIKVLPEYFG